MANNSIPNGTKVRILNKYHEVPGIVVGQSRQSDEHVIVEWDDAGFDYPISKEHVDDLVEIK